MASEATHPLLSADILPSIFIHLPPDEILLVIALVCRQWARVSRLDSLWKGLLARATGLREDAEPIIVPLEIKRRTIGGRVKPSDSATHLGDGPRDCELDTSLKTLQLNGAAKGNRRSQHMDWFRFCLESRLARILLGLSFHASAESPARMFPYLTPERDPLLWSLFPGRLYFTGWYEQYDRLVHLDLDPHEVPAAEELLEAQTSAVVQPPLVQHYRGDLLITKFEGRRFEGVIVYPSANRRDCPPSITRVDGVICSSAMVRRDTGHSTSDSEEDEDAVRNYRGRFRLRELELLRNRGPVPIYMPSRGYVSYDSAGLSAARTTVPAIELDDNGSMDGYPSKKPTPDQTIQFTTPIPDILTSPSSIELGQPFGESFGVAWEVDWEGRGEGVGRVEYALAR